jgi:magnesium transporter
MAGITPSDKPYSRTPVTEIFKNRLPWLMLLMLSATFTSMILTSFEDALAAQAALIAFIPMLMGTGGNSGSQSSVTAIRALGSGEMTGRDLPRIFFKELRVGAMCGALLALVSFGKIMLIDRLLLGNEAVTVTVAIAVSVTLAAIIVASKLVGCTLPVAAKAVGLDPAVMASPLITTLVDVLALLVYFVISANVFNLVV